VNTELRPLNLGELLDRTFQIYRTHFQLFAGIAAVGAVFTLVWTTIQTFVLRGLTDRGMTGTPLQVVNLSMQLITSVLVLIVLSLVWGAMVQTVAALYQGQPTGINLSLRALLPRWLRLASVTLSAFVVAWAPLIAVFVVIIIIFGRVQKNVGVAANAGPLMAMGFFGLSFLVLLPLCTWLSLRYILANAVCAHENTGLVQSLKRSAELGKGLRWRLLALVVVTGIIQGVIGIIFTIPVWVSIFRHALHPPLWVVIYTLLSGSVARALTTAIPGIGVALFYFDARIRKEGLDIEWSLQPELPMETAAPIELPQADPSAG
jgi:hypothetical protein